jgi:DnaJ family protein C protein 8
MVNPVLADTRDQRVDSWRSFSNGKKKKKTKVTLLG